MPPLKSNDSTRLEDMVESCEIKIVKDEPLEKIVDEAIDETIKINDEGRYKEVLKIALDEKRKGTKVSEKKISNTDLMTEALLIRSSILNLKQEYDSLDSFLSKGWKLIFALVFLTSIVSYTVAVYHHEGTLKPFIIDIIKLIFKGGVN